MAVIQPRAQMRWGIVAGLLLALTAGALSGCHRDENSEFYSGQINIPKASGLSSQERAAEERFAEYVEQDPEKAVEAYRKLFDKIVNVDNARELSKDYAPDGPKIMDETNRAGRTMYSNAVQEPSRALANAVYLQMLKEPPANDAPVVFTAGGVGSGKTTSISGAGTMQSFLNTAQLVYDTTLSDSNSSMAKIEAALKSGRKVCIIFVYRDPVEAFLKGALPRAMEDGRILSLDAFVYTHQSAPEVLLAIAKRYNGDKRMEIRVVDNTHGSGNAVQANLAFVQSVTGKYKPDQLKKLLRSKLDEAQANGSISQAVYLAFKDH